MTLDRNAVIMATIRLTFKASITKGLDSAIPNHLMEKPWKSLAWFPELKLNSIIIPMGAYKNR